MPPAPFSCANILAKGPKDPAVTDLYQMGEQIGKGAFGVVFSCTDKAKGTKLACKTINKSKLQCAEDVKDVQSEVAIMNLVAGHPNVVTLRVGIIAFHSSGLCMLCCKPCVLNDSSCCFFDWHEIEMRLSSKSPAQCMQVAINCGQPPSAGNVPALP